MTAFTLPASYKTGTATIKGPQSATVTITIASPAVVSWTAHGLSAGDTFVPTTTGALPTGLVAGTTYYVIAAGLTTNAFEVAATAGGAAINTTGSQSGTHTGSSTSFTVIGVGTAWASTIQVGDTFEGSDSRSVEVASVTDDTHLVLDHSWRGASQTAAYYRIVYAPDANRQLVKTRQMIEALKIPQTGMPMVFDATGTADIYPGQGKVRGNDPANPTILYIAKTDSLGNDISGRLATLATSVNVASRAVLSFRPTDGANAFMDFDVTGALTDGTTYYKVPVTMRSGVVPANLATLAMAGVPSGATGASGTFSAIEVIKTADYTMLAADTGKTIIFNSAAAINGFFSAVATLGATWMVLVKNIGAGTLTLDPNGSETIDGATTLTLAQNQSAIVSCNGSLLRTEAFSFGSTPIGAWDGTATAGTDIASASTINLDAASGPLINITGTTTVPTVTLGAGKVRIARAVGAFQLTASASLIVNGSTSVNYITVAEDMLLFEGYGSSVVRVSVIGGPSVGLIKTGTWVPTIKIGGGNTGLTYSIQTAIYFKIGKLVYIGGTVALSAKGTSTGAVTVESLPFTVGSGSNSSVPIAFYGPTSSVVGNVMGLVIQNGTQMQLFQGGASGSGTLSDTNIANTTQIQFGGVYLAAS